MELDDAAYCRNCSHNLHLLQIRTTVGLRIYAKKKIELLASHSVTYLALYSFQLLGTEQGLFGRYWWVDNCDEVLNPISVIFPSVEGITPNDGLQMNHI